MKQKLDIKYSKSFEINYLDSYKVITLKNPWPGADVTFKYALVEENAILPPSEKFDAIINIPISELVVTSTTHIPSLEMLGVSEALVGFPNLSYVSSETTRKRIDAGKIVELGKNQDMNTEVLIDLSPDLVIGFAVDGDNSALSIIEKTGIPVVYNSDWTETTPLGKAEWIKFFGAFFNKEEMADSIFNTIENQYNLAKESAAKAPSKPTVLSGAMYRDVWYLPQGNSWAGQLINDANGKYLWDDSEGTGSLSLHLESVLDKGRTADFWIGPGQFTSLNQMSETHSVYTKFDAFNKSNVFSFTNKKGATGGVLYYEIAPNRPDIVLKDIIKILHPELLPTHELYFFSHLE
ncbi:ABC transporter substrate-binding protein [Ulvibacter sp.]|nr:ABC transporter substrate-binding protein [Ulvibacter sp.]